MDSEKHVLVVEDEFVAAFALEEYLTSKGYRVSTAGNGVEALRILKDQRSDIDVLLTDLRMPRMGGNELINRVRLDQPQIPIIVMTAYEADHKICDGTLIKMSKPINLTEVLQNIKRVTEQK